MTVQSLLGSASPDPTVRTPAAPPSTKRGPWEVVDEGEHIGITYISGMLSGEFSVECHPDELEPLIELVTALNAARTSHATETTS